MSVQRLANIPGFSIDRVAAAAGDDPEVLRMENLDTDLTPTAGALAATIVAIGRDEDNSYLPFLGKIALREAVAQHLNRQTKNHYGVENVVITAGGTEGMFDVLLATTDNGDEVVLTDPTYAGMIYRVRLAGGVPKLVPFVAQKNEWRLDLEALRAAVTNKTRALFIMNPAMPCGAVLHAEDWKSLAEICHQHNLWLIYNAAMERILFDQRPFIHPAALPGMAERTITIGSVSKEFRMIGWRLGWVVGPHAIMNDIARVHIYNVVTPTGIAQAGALAALQSALDDLHACVAEWQRRRNVVNEQLGEFSMISAVGGWSQLLNVKELGYDSFTASKLLLEKGKIAATPMRDWGEKNGDAFVRLVFSNEPVERLATLRDRVNRALA
ncbi:pyridoxal phosphate-dependent aminotransferase [bacterium]|nr:pyridoxal phosphate-dependent aminotransferase [bacterium]